MLMWFRDVCEDSFVRKRIVYVHDPCSCTLLRLVSIFQDDNDEVEPLSTRSLTIAERAEGPDNELVAMNLCNVAGILAAQARIKVI